MILYKSDLKDLGHTAYEGDNNNLVIVTNGKRIGSDRIMLRNVLKLFGDYKITSEDDVLRPDGKCDWKFETNLPWSEYCEL